MKFCLPLNPTEGCPFLTALRAYSICINLPEGENVVRLKLYASDIVDVALKTEKRIWMRGFLKEGKIIMNANLQNNDLERGRVAENVEWNLGAGRVLPLFMKIVALEKKIWGIWPTPITNQSFTFYARFDNDGIEVNKRNPLKDCWWTWTDPARILRI